MAIRYRDEGNGCRRCGEFHPDCSPCHQSQEDAAIDRKQVLDTYDEQMCEANEEHRGSRMPEHLPSIDPLFADAAFRDFEPVSDKEKDTKTTKKEA